jgi:hypothetical protein
MPYHSPRSGDHHGDGWDHRGHDGGHGHDHDGHHHYHYGFYGAYGWVGYPYWPWYGWGYPYLPSYWNSSYDYDSEPASNYAASQYPEYTPAPYQEAQPEPEQEEPDQPASTPWPYSRPAPSGSPAPATSAPSSEAPVTLVFKDGRPNEQIHNYLLTANTLSVLDLHRRDIPVEQIDLGATAKVNRDVGVEFTLPGDER